ncbi:uridine kinase family protein [Vallitalea okinawensis]|uniref:uridine kinase family protein n=1 Tax=Vallitalea okinawensis TaxID=2078660 RepID=UPI00147844B6|nr:AAA family ATPase [Vallitalea okinawensis]
MKKPLVVGIAGGSGSGKSTTCSYIEKYLKEFSVKSIHMDDYFIEDPPMIVAPISRLIYEDHNHPDTIDFNRLLFDLEELLNRQDCQVILIEGLMTLYKDEIRDVLDLKVFVDCQADERIIRRIRRNMGWGQTFEDITSVYLDAVRYRHNEFVEPSRWHADIVLNGSKFSDTGLDVVIQWIKNNIE